MNAHRNPATRSRKFGIAVIALASFATLVACGSQDATPGAADQSPTAPSSRQAGNLGTRVCFTNSTGWPISVEITEADTGLGIHDMVDKSQFCAEGTSAITPDDVRGRIDKGSDSEIPFVANNPWVGTPKFWVNAKCIGEAQWNLKENESAVLEESRVKMVITRTPDGQWKNFDVVLSKTKGCHKRD